MLLRPIKFTLHAFLKSQMPTCQVMRGEGCRGHRSEVIFVWHAGAKRSAH